MLSLADDDTMTIVALSDTTIRLLGSPQVLTTPTSLVKELVDNALDAKAMSIDITISPNTLDRLEVRDNGHGISQDDLNSLGKRGHTSKLRSFEELRFLGGSTLGFRGEALASAVQLGDVSVTTKTDGEVLGVTAKLKASGGVKEKSSTSHPVGTTVSVINFMSKLPVRKKTFEKEANKTLIRIRQLLQAYAIARPTVRFGFKVTNGSKSSWSFVPRPHDGIRDAISQVIGRDTSLQCVEKSLKFSEAQCNNEHECTDDDISESGSNHTVQIRGQMEFKLEAFLPRPDCDILKLGKGQYLSIDGRIVSPEKGTMKKIVTLFKTYIRESIIPDSSEKLRSPFLRLNIKCPSASYDANIEPAKDDVLFSNEKLILKSMERLLKDLYGERKAIPGANIPRTSINIAQSAVLLRTASPQCLISTESSTVGAALTKDSEHSTREGSYGHYSIIHSNDDELEAQSRERATADKQVTRKKGDWGCDMSRNFAEEAEFLELRNSNGKMGKSSRMRRDAHANESENSANTSLNPWLIAKLTAPGARKLYVGGDLSSIAKGSSNNPPGTVSSKTPILTSPRSGSPQRYGDTSLLRSLTPSLPDQRTSFGVGHAISPPELGARPQSTTDDEMLFVGEPQLQMPLRRSDFVTARCVSENVLLSPPSTLVSKAVHKSKWRTGGPNRPFVSPFKQVRYQERGEGLHQTSLPDRLKPSSTQARTRDSIHDTEASCDLAWAMDFERRREIATRIRREELRNAQLVEGQPDVNETTRISPHRNRYNAAVARLESHRLRPQDDPPSSGEEPSKTTLPDHDLQASLMRHKSSTAAKVVAPGGQTKDFRVKATRLLLDKFSTDESLHQWAQNRLTDMGVIQKASNQLLEDDDYIKAGSLSQGLLMSEPNSTLITGRVRVVAESWLHLHRDGLEPEIEYRIGNLFNSSS
ncbi:hypothetical protein B0O99DRAFT_560347 [Bisporella sp. PMI_857]|nr:hypothetical protein B0O99DRAFT_560347 [Bisporella sp. PMI_857]